MLEELKLLPCPVCCGTDIRVIHLAYYNEYWAVCAGCGTETGLRNASAEAIAAWNVLPRALTWTTEPPKVAGLYYQRWNWVNHWGDADVITVEQHSIGKIKKNGDRQWAGPIPMPKEPTP